MWLGCLSVCLCVCKDGYLGSVSLRVCLSVSRGVLVKRWRLRLCEDTRHKSFHRISKMAAETERAYWGSATGFRAFLSLLWLILLAPLVQSQQRFVNQPSPQTAVIGSTVVMPCRIINKVGNLQWTRDGFGLGTERELVAYKRYKMIGSNEEGDFSLRISPVTLEDDSYFQCQVTGYQDIAGVRSQTAKLTVYVPPEPPEVLQGTSFQTTAGSGVQLGCISRGGKPAAEIQWLDGDGRVITEGIEYSTELLEDGHRRDAKSSLSFIATKEHDNALFSCTAFNPALHQPLRTQIRLEVTYPPDVTITHDREEGYKEGQTATLTCSAVGNPSQLTFRWYRSGQLVSDKNTTQLVLPDVTRDSNLEDITCEVSNAVGSSRKITRLSVHYGPSLRIPPKDEYADIGENITLRCEVDSNPDPTIVWIHQQTQTVVGKGDTLSLKVDRDRIGTFLCIAKVEGFPEVSGTIGVFLKGPPTVTSERVQWGKRGDTVLVECLITDASPRSVSVTWSHHGKEVDLDNARFEVTEDITTQGLRNTLVIHDAQPEDFGTYNCSVQNTYGADVVEIFLNKKKSLPLLLILCGVVGGIVVVLVVAMLAILCARKSARKQKADSNSGGLPEKTVTIQMNDQNSTANESDLKVEMDNRTGSSMSNKDAGDLEGWDKDLDQPPTPNYLSSTNSYLYPETFTGIPLKLNGHLAGNNGTLGYNNYAEHSTLGLGLHHSSPVGYMSGTGGLLNGGASTGSGAGANSSGAYDGVTLPPSSRHNLYRGFGDYDGQDIHDGFSSRAMFSTAGSGAAGAGGGNGNGGGGGSGGNGGGTGASGVLGVGNGGIIGGGTGGLVGLSSGTGLVPGLSVGSTYSNGYTNQSFKNSAVSLPLSTNTTVVNSPTTSSSSHANTPGSSNTIAANNTINSASASGGPPTSSTSNTLSNNSINSSGVPRLGIPVDPSQYIIPPRTQVMQGALATHV